MSGVSDKLSMLADDEESKDPPPYTWYTSIGGQSLSEKVIFSYVSSSTLHPVSDAVIFLD